MTDTGQLPAGWRWAKMGDVCQLNPRRPEIQRADTELMTFVPMAAIDEGGAGISRAELKPYSQVRKGYTYFGEGDVLFAKITPCMQNGKHAIARNLTHGIGFGSTEFHVLRPRKETVAEWIHYFLLQPCVLDAATEHFSGTVGQQRLPENYLSNLQIPLPTLEEQRWIVARLREQLAEVTRARAAVQAQLTAAEVLPAAHLRVVFQAPAAQRWPHRNLGELLALRKEVVHPRDNPRGPATFVGLEHIESTTGRRIGSVDVEMGQLTGRKPRFHQGDIVYGYLRPYLNKVWIAEFDGLCSVDQYVYAVDGEKADTDFIAWFMRSPVYLERAPIDTTPGQLPRIRTEEVASVEVNLPSPAEQRSVVNRIRAEFAEVTRLREALAAELAEIERLPAALLREAFGPAGGRLD